MGRQLEDLLAAGFPRGEAQAYVLKEAGELSAAGFTGEEIDAYLGPLQVQDKSFTNAGLRAMFETPENVQAGVRRENREAFNELMGKAGDKYRELKLQRHAVATWLSLQSGMGLEEVYEFYELLAKDYFGDAKGGPAAHYKKISGLLKTVEAKPKAKPLEAKDKEKAGAGNSYFDQLALETQRTKDILTMRRAEEIEFPYGRIKPISEADMRRGKIVSDAISLAERQTLDFERIMGDLPSPIETVLRPVICGLIAFGDKAETIVEGLDQTMRGFGEILGLWAEQPDDEERQLAVMRKSREIKRMLLAQELGPVEKVFMDTVDVACLAATAWAMAPAGAAIPFVFGGVAALDMYAELADNGVSRPIAVPAALLAGGISGLIELATSVVPGGKALFEKIPGGAKGFIIRGVANWLEEGADAINRNTWVGKIVPKLQEALDPNGDKLPDTEWKRIGEASWEDFKAAGPVSFALPLTMPVFGAFAHSLRGVRPQTVLDAEAKVRELEWAHQRKAELDERFEKAGVVEVEPTGAAVAADDKPAEGKGEAKDAGKAEADAEAAAEAKREADEEALERDAKLMVLEGLFDEELNKQAARAERAAAQPELVNITLDDFRSQVRMAGIKPETTEEGQKLFKYFRKGAANGIDQWFTIAVGMKLANEDENAYTAMQRLMGGSNVVEAGADMPPLLFARDVAVGDKVDGNSVSGEPELVVDKAQDGSIVTLTADGKLQRYRAGEAVAMGDVRGQADADELIMAQERYGMMLEDDPAQASAEDFAQAARAERGFLTDAERERVAALSKRLGKELGSLGAGVPNPKIIKTLAEIAATYLKAGTRNAAQGFKEYSEYILRKLGEKARPYLQAGWDKALEAAKKKEAKAAEKEKGKGESKEAGAAEKKLEPLTPDELDERNWLAQSDEVLLRDFEEGRAEWKRIIDMVEGALSQDIGEGRQDQLKKRRLTAIRKLMNLPEIPPHERISYAKAFYEAVSTDMMLDVTARARYILATPEAILQPNETVAFELKLEELEDERSQLWREQVELQEAGKVAEAGIKGQRLEALRQDMNVITLAASRAGTTTAQALAARRWHTRRQGRMVQLFYQEAVAAKRNRPFTPEEKSQVDALQKELEQANMEVLKWTEKAAQDALRANQALAKANILAAAETLWRQKKRRSQEKILADRKHIIEELKKVGVRVKMYEIFTGTFAMTGRTGDLVGRLLKTYIEEGIVSADELVNQINAVLPDVSRANVLEVLASRPLANLDAAVERAQKMVKTVRKQGEVARRLDDLDTNNAKAVDAARNTLAELVELELDTNPDSIQVQNLKRKIGHAEEMLRDRFRDIKKKRPPVSEEVADLQKRLREIQALIRTEDKIADLQHQLETGNLAIKPVIEAAKTSEQLAQARNKLRRLEKQAKIAVEGLRDRNALDESILALEAVGGSMRMLQASGEMSGWGRQGLMMMAYLAMRGPKGLKAIKTAFSEAFRATFKEEQFDTLMNAIYNDPRHYIREGAGLQITDPDLGMLPGEELFMRNVAQALPKYIGKLPYVQWSERNMIAGLNLLRVAAFDMAAEANPQWTQDQITEWAAIVNTMSGRSDWLARSKTLGPAGLRIASLAFFAPNFAMSRVEAPARLAWALRPGSATRMEAVRAGAGYLAVNAAFIGLAKLAGATISFDPEEFDFLRVVWGKTRVDLMAGLNQPFRVGLTAALYYADAAGVRNAVRKSKPGDAFYRFLKYKRSPLAGITDIIEGRDIFDRPVPRSRQAVEMALPLYWSEVYRTFKANAGMPSRGMATGAVAVGGFFGAGTATVENPLMVPEIRDIYRSQGINKIDPPRWLGQVKDREYIRQKERVIAEFNDAAAAWLMENPDADKEGIQKGMERVRAKFKPSSIPTKQSFADVLDKDNNQEDEK